MRWLGRAALGVATIAVGIGALSTDARTGSAGMIGLSSSGVSGYTLSGVHYELDADPTLVTGVSFELDAQPQGDIRIRLAAASPWTTCSVVERRASCPVAGLVRVRDVDRLDVVAAA